MKRSSFLLLISCVIILTLACTGFKKLDNIRATDYYSEVKCEIPLKIPWVLPTSEYLHTDDSIEELKSKFDEISNEKDNFTTKYLPHKERALAPFLFVLRRFSHENCWIACY